MGLHKTYIVQHKDKADPQKMGVGFAAEAAYCAGAVWRRERAGL
jgi:hypothetical protein